MKEYKITDGYSVIIDMARSIQDAYASAARRLDCDETALTILSIKNRPVGGHRTGRKEDVTSVFYHDARRNARGEEKTNVL